MREWHYNPGNPQNVDSLQIDHFLYLGTERVLTFDGETNQLNRRNTWGVLGELVIDEVFGGANAASRWAVTDHLGTVTDLINMAGNEIVEHREYDAFGAIDAAFDQSGSAVAAANLKTPIGFTGQVFESQTGLSYHAARWYDPGTGRFMSEDPIGEGANHYRYAGNDPVNFYDPTGLSQAGNPLNALAGRNASAGRSIIPVGNFNDTGYNTGPRNSFSISTSDVFAASPSSFGGTGYAAPRNTPTAQQFNSLATNTNIVQQVARAPAAQPVDVNRNSPVLNSKVFGSTTTAAVIGSSTIPFGTSATTAIVNGAARVVSTGRTVAGVIAAAPAAPVAAGVAAAVVGPYAGYRIGQKLEDTFGLGKIIGDFLVPGPANNVVQSSVNGSKGNPDHQEKVRELVDKARSELRPGETVVQEQQVRGHSSTRRPDVQIRDTDGNTRKVFEAERHPNRQRNLNREEEYRRLKIPYETHPLGQ